VKKWHVVYRTYHCSLCGCPIQFGPRGWYHLAASRDEEHAPEPEADPIHFHDPGSPDPADCLCGARQIWNTTYPDEVTCAECQILLSG